MRIIELIIWQSLILDDRSSIHKYNNDLADNKNIEWLNLYNYIEGWYYLENLYWWKKNQILETNMFSEYIINNHNLKSFLSVFWFYISSFIILFIYCSNYEF
jgi:hypothetical protein